MARECKCKKDWKVRCRDYIAKGKHSDVYMKTIFQEGCEYFFYNKGEDFFVTTEKRYLKDIERFNIYIEEMNEVEFDKHFDCEKKFNTKTQVSQLDENAYRKTLNTYNELIEKVNLETDIFSDGLNFIDKNKLKTASRNLGFGLTENKNKRK